jgi:hypothetical protein
LARLALPAARLAVAAAFAWLTAVWVTHRVVGGDTPWLVDGTDALAGCLSRHDFDACGFTGRVDAAGQMSAVGPYPLLQYVPDYLARWIGATHDTRYTTLALLGTLAVFAVLALGWLVLSRIGEGAWFWALVLVVLTGPLIVYANTTWGELLAAGLLVCLVAAVVLRAPPPVVAGAVFAACLTKETSYPFVAAIAALGLVLAWRRTRASIRAHLVWGGAGLAAAVVVASLFNRVRFGTLENTNYLQPEFRAPLDRVPEFFAGLLVAPNGGILLFWASASLLSGALLLVPFVRRGSERFDRWVAVVLALIAVGITVSLAMWWAPFGWIAWGPRLSLPWVLPLLLLALVAFGSAARPFAARLLATPWRLLVVAAAVLALTLPHVGYLWRPQTTTEFFAHRSERCTSSRPFGSSAYYTCLREQMWTQRPIMNDALSGLGRAGGAFTAVLVAAAVAGSLVLLREGIAPVSAEERAGQREAARGARAALPR